MSMFNIPADETPEQAEERKRRRIAQALMAQQQQMPQDVGQGLMALGSAVIERQARQNAAFPTAPGNGGNWATNLRNLVTGGRNGGLY